MYAKVPPPPPTLVLKQAKFSFTGQKCRNNGHCVWMRPCFLRGTYYTAHVANISQCYPSQYDNAKHSSSCAQLKYHSVACILIDKPLTEPLPNLGPHLEELDILAGQGDCMGKATSSNGGIMLFFMTIALIHNAIVPQFLRPLWFT